jgi:hypothetical protein
MISISRCMELLEKGKHKCLGCATCGQPLVSKDAIFNVPGAEGVTGAYVNAHGLVFIQSNLSLIYNLH